MTNQDNIDAWSKVPQHIIGDFGEEGDFGRQHLLNPHLLRLAGDVTSKSVLDAGSGNGYLSRKLARLGAKVTGVEPAASLFEYAQNSEHQLPLGITYHQQDLSSFHAPRQFDLVIANMVFMDIPDWQSAMQNCIDALNPGGLLVFSIAHPAFENPSSEFNQQGYVKIYDYLHEYAKGATYGSMFHRTISTYLNFIIQHGCTITEVIEPQLGQNLSVQFPEHQRTHYIPNYLIVAATKHAN